MAKKFFFKGKELDELKRMPLDEFILLANSHARRSLKRMGMQIKKFLEKMRKAKSKGKPMKTHFRQMVVIPEMVGMHFKVHAGNSWADVVATQEMVGRRLGEFAHTCKLVKHSGPGIGATRGSKAVELK